jgi:AsmA protein
MKSRGVKIGIGIVVALIVLVLIVPLFVNADSFRPTLESELSSALGRKVTLGHLSFSLWSGSVSANNLTVADDPAFSTEPFLQAKSLHVGVHVGDFLFHHQLNVTKFVANDPQIQLISNAKGTWNYASLARGSSTSSGSSSSNTQVTVGKFQISNGSVAVSSVPATGKPFVYSDVNVTVNNVSLTQAMPFTVSAKLPADGSVDLIGTVGPVNQQNAEATPFQAKLTVKHFDPVKAGVLPASEGVGMVADVDAQAQSNGKTATSSGKITAQHLLLSRDGTPAAQPVDLDYTVNDDIGTQQGTIQDITVHAGQAAAHVNGTFQTAGQQVQLNLHVSAPGMPVDAVENLLPAMGIRLPSGSRLHGGTITAQLAITGTAAAPEIKGPIEVDNTELAGFDLAQKMQGLKMLGNAQNATRIQVLKAEVDSTVPQTTLSNIDANLPSIGTATGEGTVTAAGGLNFQLTAKLNSSSQVGSMANAATSALGGVAGGLLHSTVSNGIPLTITGTTSSPVIRANVAQMLKGNMLGQNKGGTKPSAGSVLKGLMGPH